MCYDYYDSPIPMKEQSYVELRRNRHITRLMLLSLGDKNPGLTSHLKIRADEYTEEIKFREKENV